MVILFLRGQTITGFQENPKWLWVFSIDNVINKTGDLMHVKNFLTDTMYTVSKDYKFIPFMILNTGGKGITPGFLANVPPPDNSGSSPLAKFLMLSEIIETDRYLFHRHYYQGAGTPFRKYLFMFGSTLKPRWKSTLISIPGAIGVTLYSKV